MKDTRGCGTTKSESDASNGENRSFWRKLRGPRAHRCNDLLATNEVFQHLNLENRRILGVQSVRLDRIVGSSGRHQDFDLSFRSLRKPGARWRNVAEARRQGVELPPVSLYKVGDAYFVEDGNHRISVAREEGQESIKAFVIEIDASPLRPESSCTRLGYKL